MCKFLSLIIFPRVSAVIAEERLDSLLKSLAKETLPAGRDDPVNEAAALSPSVKATGESLVSESSWICVLNVRCFCRGRHLVLQDFHPGPS
jgi:hypothetical protein